VERGWRAERPTIGGSGSRGDGPDVVGGLGWPKRGRFEGLAETDRLKLGPRNTRISRRSRIYNF
jgi:hypothetical protein